MESRMYSHLLRMRPRPFHNLNPSAQLAPTPSSAPVKWKFDWGRKQGYGLVIVTLEGKGHGNRSFSTKPQVAGGWKVRVFFLDEVASEAKSKGGGLSGS